MIDSKLSFLSWLAIANTTITSRNLYTIQNANAVLLPKQMFSKFTFDHIRFSQINNIVSYQSLLFNRCFTEQNSFFTLFNSAPLEIKDTYFRNCNINSNGQKITVINSKFNLTGTDSFISQKSKKAVIKNSEFTSSSSKPILSFTNAKNTFLRSCNFSNLASGAITFSKSNSLQMHLVIFHYCRAENGAAIYADLENIHATMIQFSYNYAQESGGAVYIPNSHIKCAFSNCHFQSNFAIVGKSIFNEGLVTLTNCIFTYDKSVEISGDCTVINSTFNSNNRRIRIVTIAPPPTASVPSTKPAFTTEIQAQVEAKDDPIALIIVIVTVLCVVVIIGIAFFIYWRMKKQRNTIYASEKEAKDENEMGTVEIKSKYSLSKVYDL